MKEVDIIIDSPVRYANAGKDSVKVKIDNLTIPVISIDELILMKKNTGCPMDRLDVESLKRVKKLRRK